jgi:hypothetical protein
MSKRSKKFKFHVPMELIKGKEDSLDSWKIKGIASTDDEDLQGETVNQTGLDITPLKAGRGLFNVDHQKGPENVIGQVEDAEFVDNSGKSALMVKGYLFQHQERAKAFYNIMRSIKKGNSPRVHLSIEGKIIQRDMTNTKRIKKARIEKVALTLDPVNPNTYASLVKSLNSDEEIPVEQEQDFKFEITKTELAEIVATAVKKALSAGAGYDKAPRARVQGEAMSSESLEDKEKKVTYEDKKKKKKDVIKSLIEDLCQVHPDLEPMELAGWVIEAFIDRNKKGE